MADVRMALRYQATPGLPLASLRSAAGPKDEPAALVLSIELTNHLLGQAVAIEVNVIANRLVLVHRSLMPALYVLVRRGRVPEEMAGLDIGARTALALVKTRREVSVGDVRHHLGLRATPRHDPGYEALSALQRQLLVDRGPFERPARGIPYLPKEGYPYHLFHEAHRDLVTASATLTVAEAADGFLAAYLDGAVLATPRRLTSLFRAFLTPAEINASLDRLVESRRIVMQRVGRETLAIAFAER